ncbi:MAG: hypothetical protein JW904_11045 [Spirochaetales bacterium]|nr:hypothetical protein [Spirochaetales bacterium]
MKKMLFVLLILCFSFYLYSEELQEFNPDTDFAQVMYVRMQRQVNGTWIFDVTVRHHDQGWKHYAGLREVIDPANGELLEKRVLLHPHDTEQPFTRSESGIIIPAGVKRAIVRAKCTQHGFNGKQIAVDFSQQKTDEYEIIK